MLHINCISLFSSYVNNVARSWSHLTTRAMLRQRVAMEEERIEHVIAR